MPLTELPVSNRADIHPFTPTDPKQGQFDAEVPWFNVSGTVYEADPAEMKDGVSMRCQCYAFYGMEASADGTSCVAGPNTALLTIMFFVIIAVSLVFALSYGFTTLAQMILTGAFQFNPATITLILCNIAAVCQTALMFVYLNSVGGELTPHAHTSLSQPRTHACAPRTLGPLNSSNPHHHGPRLGGDADYSMNDGLRGPILGLFLVGVVAGSVEVLIMWIDVLGKSKKMTAKGSGMKKIKTGLHAFNVFLLLITVLSLALGATTALAGFAAVTLIILVGALTRGGAKLAKLMQGTSETKSAAVGAIETVSSRFPAIFLPGLIGIVGFGALGKKFDRGHIGFYLLNMTFFVATFLLNILISYVRFGARKKLCRAGYMQENLNLGASTGGTTMGTKVTPQPSGTVSTQDLETPGRTTGGATVPKISPVLVLLNKIWALGFPL